MFILLHLLFFWTTPQENVYSVKVCITGFSNSKGTAHVALYNKSTDFPDYGKQMEGKVVSIKDNKCEVWFKNLKQGSYALAVYHDENNNNKLDKNLFGAPTESYGFSNNVRPMFSAPTFDECKYYLASDKSVNIKVK
ncbi:MAG: DUF2141 domain-containing protein [Flavobacteriia bacterium]|nr:DUF2141 domain-containing protein [Flavobacteriia bacterium]